MYQLNSTSCDFVGKEIEKIISANATGDSLEGYKAVSIVKRHTWYLEFSVCLEFVRQTRFNG